MTLGAIPTRTGVEIRSEHGVASIPAATTRSAGAMTAGHVASLEDLLAWRVGIESGTHTIVVQQAAAPAPVDPEVLRSIVLPEVLRIVRDEVAPQITRQIEAVAPAPVPTADDRLAALERRLEQIETRPEADSLPVVFQGVPSDETGRLDRFEERLKRIELERSERPANDHLPRAIEDLHRGLKELRERFDALAAEAGKRSRVPAPVIVDPQPELTDRIEAIEAHIEAGNELRERVPEILKMMLGLMHEVKSIGSAHEETRQLALGVTRIVAAGGRG